MRHAIGKLNYKVRLDLMDSIIFIIALNDCMCNKIKCTFFRTFPSALNEIFRAVVFQYSN